MGIFNSCVKKWKSKDDKEEQHVRLVFLGPPGCGKSDLVLRLLGCGWMLVADDQVSVVREFLLAS